MRNRFDNELQELNNNLIKMAALCEQIIALALECFEENSEEILEQVKSEESRIDEYEHEIERKCLRLLLQQQPVAKDLRRISAILKMITDLERIGDQALDIADFSKDNKILSPKIKTMAEESIKIVSLAIDAMIKDDLELAQKTISADDLVDTLFFEIKHDIIDILKSENSDSERALDMLMIAKYLERIADHAVNVSEWVIFSITGVHKGDNHDCSFGR